MDPEEVKNRLLRALQARPHTVYEIELRFWRHSV